MVISRFKALAKVTCLSLLLGACRTDDSYTPSGESVQVKLAVSSGVLPGSQTRVGGVDDLISSVCILQFYANGDAYGNLCRVARGTPGTAAHYTASLVQSAGVEEKFKLVVLANLPSYSFLYGMEGSSYEVVQKACMSAAETGPLTFSQENPFPMFGVLEGGKPIQVQQNTAISDIALLRAVARVDIGLGTKDPVTGIWDKGNIPFNMDEIQVWKRDGRYLYLPETGKFHVSPSNSIVMDAPSAVAGESNSTITYTNASITAQTYCSGSIYLPEAMIWPNPQSSDTYGPDYFTRQAIIVGGYYKGSERKTYYRMDFSQENPKKLLDILRNSVYEFTITDVADAGFDTAAEAYNSIPVGLTFSTSIDAWKPGVSAKPAAQEGYLMIYGGKSGSITNNGSPSSFPVKKKSEFWEGENSTVKTVVDYNTFYGEIPGNLRRSTAYPNGDIYPLDTGSTASQKLLEVEGAYPVLMVAPDDLYTLAGSATVYWKTGTELTAFNLCREYSGLGYSDWRLPRGPELLLMRYNRTSLEVQRGFSPFSGIYWSGSECDMSPNAPAASLAMAVSFDTDVDFFSAKNKTSSSLKVRCVRQLPPQVLK